MYNFFQPYGKLQLFNLLFILTLLFSSVSTCFFLILYFFSPLPVMITFFHYIIKILSLLSFHSSSSSSNFLFLFPVFFTPFSFILYPVWLFNFVPQFHPFISISFSFFCLFFSLLYSSFLSPPPSWSLSFPVLYLNKILSLLSLLLILFLSFPHKLCFFSIFLSLPLIYSLSNMAFWLYSLTFVISCPPFSSAIFLFFSFSVFYSPQSSLLLENTQTSLSANI